MKPKQTRREVLEWLLNDARKKPLSEEERALLEQAYRETTQDLIERIDNEILGDVTQ